MGILNPEGRLFRFRRSGFGPASGGREQIMGPDGEKVEAKRYYHWSGRGFLPEVFGSQLAGLIRDVRRETGKAGVIYLCIGSDRSTGDSLGPLVGYRLCRMAPEEALVLGTLQRPVHAVNLKATVEFIRRCYSDRLIVAVDASVGSEEHVGGITLGLGPICPGLGVRKKLQEVGDIYITGVVHSGKSLEPELLQSTRLALVMELAECICSGILALETAEFSGESAETAACLPADSVERFCRDGAPV